MNIVNQFRFMVYWSMNISQDKVKKFSRGRQGSCLIILGGIQVNSVLEGYTFNNNYDSLYCFSLVFFDNYRRSIVLGGTLQ